MRYVGETERVTHLDLPLTAPHAACTPLSGVDHLAGIRCGCLEEVESGAGEQWPARSTCLKTSFTLEKLQWGMTQNMVWLLEARRIGAL